MSPEVCVPLNCLSTITFSSQRILPNAIHAVHVIHKCGIDAAVPRPAARPIQPEETPVGRLEGARVDPLVHVLKERYVSDSGRWAKGAPLHAGAYDAQDVVVSVVEIKKSRPPSRVGEERLLGRRHGVWF